MSKTIGHNVNRVKEYFSVTRVQFNYGSAAAQKRYLKKRFRRLARLDGKKTIQREILGLAKEARKEAETLAKRASILLEHLCLHGKRMSAEFEYQAYLAVGDCNQERIYFDQLMLDVFGHTHGADHISRCLWDEYEFDKHWDAYIEHDLTCCEIEAYENSADPDEEPEEWETVHAFANRRKSRKTVRGY